MQPSVTGLSWPPSISTILPSLTVTDRVHESGQSRGHAVVTDTRGSRSIASCWGIGEVYTKSPNALGPTRMPHPPHVVIIGGGFGGLAAAQALKRAPVSITLLDRRNHHLFQPLLYQVATAGLSPGDIAAPIRWILRRQRNVRVLLAEARRIDVAARTVELDEGSLNYDYLVVATGA